MIPVLRRNSSGGLYNVSRLAYRLGHGSPVPGATPISAATRRARAPDTGDCAAPSRTRRARSAHHSAGQTHCGFSASARLAPAEFDDHVEAALLRWPRGPPARARSSSQESTHARGPTRTSRTPPAAGADRARTRRRRGLSGHVSSWPARAAGGDARPAVWQLRRRAVASACRPDEVARLPVRHRHRPSATLRPVPATTRRSRRPTTPSAD